MEEAIPNTPSATNFPPPSLRLCNESVKLEDQLVRLPLEKLKKSARNSNRALALHKEMNAIITSVAEAAQKHDLSKEAAIQSLTSLHSNFRGLKRKFNESIAHDETQIRRCRARLHHLSDPLLLAATKEDRILLDYMLRSSCHQSAIKLAETRGIDHDLVDLEFFTERRTLIETLKNGDFGPALKWCADNRHKLKKTDNKLEFRLMRQEFIELIRANRLADALQYARKHLAAFANIYPEEFMNAMGALVLKSDTMCEKYKALLDPKQLDDLVKLFIGCWCEVSGVSSQALLKIYLQAGLSALKSPACDEGKCRIDVDPLAQDSFRRLAAPLPYAKHIHSNLVCYITKEAMDEENPPLAFPNGYVYGAKAMKDMAAKNKGKVTCPRSGLVCGFQDLKRVFII